MKNLLPHLHVSHWPTAAIANFLFFTYNTSSELEIDEGLHVARFDLDDDKDDDDDEEGFDHQGAFRDESLALVGECLGQEMEHVAKEHEAADGGV